jgi:hypothetical protein
MIRKCRPVIYYENIQFEIGEQAKIMFNYICEHYPQYHEESKFDIKKYCMENLGYSKCIDRFNDGIDCLLIP